MKSPVELAILDYWWPIFTADIDCRYQSRTLRAGFHNCERKREEEEIREKLMNNFEAMLLARKVRMVLLIAFGAFMTYKGAWFFVGITVILIGLTLWQNKRLREEIAIQQARDTKGVGSTKDSRTP